MAENVCVSLSEDMATVRTGTITYRMLVRYVWSCYQESSNWQGLTWGFVLFNMYCQVGYVLVASAMYCSSSCGRNSPLRSGFNLSEGYVIFYAVNMKTQLEKFRGQETPMFFSLCINTKNMLYYFLLHCYLANNLMGCGKYVVTLLYITLLYTSTFSFPLGEVWQGVHGFEYDGDRFIYYYYYLQPIYVLCNQMLDF